MPRLIAQARLAWRGRGGAGAAAVSPGRSLVAACLLLTACSAMEEASRPPLDTLATRMPAEIAGFVLGDAAQRPGPTLALDYATRNRAAVATVLVYGTGGRAAPSDPAAPEFDRELSSAVTEVTEAPSGRTGRRLTEQRRVTVADPGLRCAVMSGAFGRAPVTRHVCIGSAEGRFVKVQVTMASGAPSESADAMAFAAGVVRAVRGG
ncbi:hypothetical protein GXW74_07495 [Roseomonas eburnea]|uniref:Lipoprotein n=1 Tax=Neoroseomonas eburnea TaxID=1346889 RepID=A0A9X9X9E0_9PROT|nr:hypothetical protein [Neoroseomonas eburnea]MBR0680326.1 hypothetical protein [Neoroseomonas eburnea]